jgi:hypothetical protein
MLINTAIDGKKKKSGSGSEVRPLQNVNQRREERKKIVGQWEEEGKVD